ncbi:MAG: phosphoribosylformylglycinamidine cyclo-ligase [Coriobacteriia bacterium]|nr:phosphoribosylformylglycinamidine cyclo-ligase [Coriobacteriia bacterium]
MKEEISYKDAGVDTAEGARAVDKIKASVKATYRPEVLGDLGGFGGLFSLAKAKDMEDPILVSGTDGVGTKLELAKRLNKHNTVGIDLVAMCANDILVSGAEPLFFLDYIAIGKLDAEFVAQVVAGVAEGCMQAGCSLIGGEMAEHPGVMQADDYDLSGFCVGLVDKPKMLDTNKVQNGDLILGLASSGLHSNGFSLVRRAYSDTLSDEELHTHYDDLDGKSIAEALLAPTRIYVKPILSALKAGLELKALAHITGGGITENLNRSLPKGSNAQVKRGAWKIPGIIQRVINAAHLSEEEAYKTFNMGIGMAIICAPEDASSIKEHLEAAGETVYAIGEIVEGSQEVVYLDD